MAKQGLTFETCAGILREKSSQHGWALCIGAGTSLPLFPSWNGLIVSLMEGIEGKARGKDLALKLLSEYSPDSVIEACAHRSGRSPASFARLLSTELYRNLKGSTSGSEWDLIKRVLSIDAPARLKELEWHKFIEIIRNKFPTATALTLARMISAVHTESYAPSAILSFNAEPLLYALIHAEHACARAWERGKDVNGAEWVKSPPKILDRITQSIKHATPGRIPYFHCHGLLGIPHVRQPAIAHPLDKLVFSETDYLQLANSNFSWQSTVFMNVCSFRSVLFVGVSLSDPNMRRWLSWIHQNKQSELKASGLRGGDSTSHYWINQKPSDTSEQRWIESVMAHLGVRLIWLDTWSEIDQVLQLSLRCTF
jgi:hypothetical protein